MTSGAWFCTGLSIGLLVGTLLGYMLFAAVMLETPLAVQRDREQDRLEPELTEDDPP
ncbi:unnamed protein product [marine sediment metagenome]|uniref:Uncharacterized protein n=1 Tax=marine sediment metagenome TaxID=412755 RepID=X1I7I9_9ZZZZ